VTATAYGASYGRLARRVPHNAGMDVTTRARLAADRARLAERELLLRARLATVDGVDTWLADLERKLAAAGSESAPER
jgi:hypothetical protein